MPPKPKQTTALCFSQILAPTWQGAGNQTYTLYGLSDDGKVYQYKRAEDEWVELGVGNAYGTTNNPPTKNTSPTWSRSRVRQKPRYTSSPDYELDDDKYF